MIVAGIGSRKGVAAAEVVALVERALAEARIDQGMLSALATIEAKAREPGIIAAAAQLGLQLLAVPFAENDPSTGGTAASPPSDATAAASRQRFGGSSVSETAALAAAGEGSRLVRPRIKSAGATCALARSAQS